MFSLVRLCTIFSLVSLLVLANEQVKKRDRNTKPYKVVCYYGTWAVYRPGEGRFAVEDIDPFICTHIVYGFAGLGSDNRIKSLDSYLDLVENWGKGAFQRFNNLKNINPELTTILAIGGWNEGSQKYSNMAASAETRKIFVDSCVDFLLKHGFDGLDVDWEYPANRGGKPEDKQNFILLLQDLRKAFDQHGLLVTAAVSAGKATIDTAYDIPAMTKALDIINLMAYDYHGAWETVTGHNAPLFGRPGEKADDVPLNVNYSVNYWIQNGADPRKIVLGMGLYGRSFSLAKEDENGLGALAYNGGSAGPYTRAVGTLGYNEICDMQMKEGGRWTVVWADGIEAPYAYRDRLWVGYDNVKSIKIKTEFAKKMGLGGGMVWSIETDDFHGKCHGIKFPLLSAINEVLYGSAPRPYTGSYDGTTTAAPRPTDHRKIMTEEPEPHKPDTSDEGTQDGDDSSDGPSVCKSAGIVRNPDDCTKFYICAPAQKGYTPVAYDCPAHTAFDATIGACQWRDVIKC